MRLLALSLAFSVALLAGGAAAQEFPSSEEARAHETMGRFAEAAVALEREVAALPNANSDALRARAWIERAITYRVALGDVEGAMRGVRELARRGSDRVAEVELDVAVILERTRRWRESVRFHEAWLRRYARDAPQWLRLRAQVQFADALRQSGNTARAGVIYRTVSAEASQWANRVGDPHFERLRPFLARAGFWEAEASYRASVAQRFPRYVGAGTRRSYDLWMARVMSPFIGESMRQLNEDFTRLYTRVVNLHEPQWEVESYGRLAYLFYRFAALIGGAPPPPDIWRHPDLRDLYCERFDEPPVYCGGPNRFAGTAVEGFQRCLRTASTLRWPAPSICEEALAQIDPMRFPPAEIRPTPDQGCFGCAPLAVSRQSNPPLADNMRGVNYHYSPRFR